jgi:hypothetical protein
MGWCGRAPAPPAYDAGTGLQIKGAPPCPTNQIRLLPRWASTSARIPSTPSRGAPRQAGTKEEHGPELVAALGRSAGSLLRSDGAAALALEGCDLDFQVLIRGADAGIADNGHGKWSGVPCLETQAPMFLEMTSARMFGSSLAASCTSKAPPSERTRASSV